MKKVVIGMATLLSLSLWLTGALAVTQDDAQALAVQAAGDGVQVRRTERDDGLYEVSLSDESAIYEVDVRERDGAIIEVKRTVIGAARATSFEITADQASEAAKALDAGATAVYVQQDRDDGACVYEVFYSAEGELGSVTVDAQTAQVVKTLRWPEAAKQGVISAQQAADKALARQAGELTDLELSYDERRGYEYEGEIRVGAMAYAFEMDALTGTFTGWERDD